MYIDEKYLAERFGVERSSALNPPAKKKTKRSSRKSEETVDQTTEASADKKESQKKEFEDTPAAAFNQLERWVVRRDYAVLEATRKLKRLGYSDASINAAIERGLRCGYLDDARYADSLIRSRLSQGKGLAGIERSLSDFGISAYDIPGYPEEYVTQAPSQLDAAIDLLNRKPPRSKNRRQGAYAKLMRSGYTSAIAAQAARIWAEGD